MLSLVSTSTPFALRAPAKISASRVFSAKFADPMTTAPPDIPSEDGLSLSSAVSGSLPPPHAASSRLAAASAAARLERRRGVLMVLRMGPRRGQVGAGSHRRGRTCGDVPVERGRRGDATGSALLPGGE